MKHYVKNQQKYDRTHQTYELKLYSLDQMLEHQGGYHLIPFTCSSQLTS